MVTTTDDIAEPFSGRVTSRWKAPDGGYRCHVVWNNSTTDYGEEYLRVCSHEEAMSRIYPIGKCVSFSGGPRMGMMSLGQKTVPHTPNKSTNFC